MKTWVAIGSIAIALVLGTSLEAQRRFPGAAEATSGRAITPAFEGWYENPDGTYTLSFGYFNRDSEEVFEIPIGPDNFIEPARFDGRQPTILSTRRHTGVFTVTIQRDFASEGGRVVWTLRNQGETYSVPGRIGAAAYQLHYLPMAMGSLPPLLKLTPDGLELWGNMTHVGDPRVPSTWEAEDPIGSLSNPLPVVASVGTPLTLTAWAADRLAPGAERDPVDTSLTWFIHQGPGLNMVDFLGDEPDPNDGGFGRPPPGPNAVQIPRDSDGSGTVTAVFSVPGEYLLRVRADNFNPVDSSSGDQCCWTHGYVQVTVSP